MASLRTWRESRDTLIVALQSLDGTELPRSLDCEVEDFEAEEKRVETAFKAMEAFCADRIAVYHDRNLEQPDTAFRPDMLDGARDEIHHGALWAARDALERREAETRLRRQPWYVRLLGRVSEDA